MKNTIAIWVFLGSVLILSLKKIVWRTYILPKTISNLKWSYVRGQKVKCTSITLSHAVFSFWWIQKKRFSQGTKLKFTFSWSIFVTHWLSISHNFQNGKVNIASINSSNRDSHFWYELSLLQWLIPISGTWASNAMCSFSMHSLLMQSKDRLTVIRQSPTTFCALSL